MYCIVQIVCFLTQVYCVEATITQDTQSVGMQSLPAHYTTAQANTGKIREKVKSKREEMGHDDNFKVIRINLRQEQRKGGKNVDHRALPLHDSGIGGLKCWPVTQTSKVVHKINIH